MERFPIVPPSRDAQTAHKGVETFISSRCLFRFQEQPEDNSDNGNQSRRGWAIPKRVLETINDLNNPTFHPAMALLINDDNSPHTLTGGTGNDTIFGNGGDDTLLGLGGNDSLDGGLGNDSMTGSTGNDTYVVNSSGDAVIEKANEGTDLVKSSINYTLGANVENLTLIGAANVRGTGNDLQNTLTGNVGNNRLEGAAGNDKMYGGAGNDTLLGGLDNDYLDGESGIDSMVGGVGDDTYVVDHSGDLGIEKINEGTDVVKATSDYTLGENIENLILFGGADLDGTGNNLANYIRGNSGDNSLAGGAGDDTVFGGAGHDTLVGGEGSNKLYGEEGDDRLVAGTGFWESDSLYGGAGRDTLVAGDEGKYSLDGGLDNDSLAGGDGADTLNGGEGSDSLRGGAGGDTYVIDSPGDLVVETAAGGTDLVQSAINYTLGTNVEKLTLTAVGNLWGAGNSLKNGLTGNAGNNRLYGYDNDDTLDGAGGSDSLSGGDGRDFLFGNTGHDTLLGGNDADNLDGGAGNDSMLGGAGDDSYRVDSAGDIVSESGSGFDEVNTTITYTLGAHLEGLVLEGDEDINGTGNALDNTIYGNRGDNVLLGAAGNDTLSGGGWGNHYFFGFYDTLAGGTGNDRYYSNAAHQDTIIEKAGEGTDVVVTEGDYSLGSYVENLIISAAPAFDTGYPYDWLFTYESSVAGHGNALDNHISLVNTESEYGDWSAGYLFGGTGNDTIYGGWGADVLNGEEDDDYLFGDDGEDILRGGAGNDTMDGTGDTYPYYDFIETLTGGLGDDTYIIDELATTTGDLVEELASEGTDEVIANVSGYVLTANVENLTLAEGIEAGTGNSLNNRLTGNASANTLAGSDGDDTLIGGAGNDSLDGGAGSDSLVGGLNHDTYTIDALTDIVSEAAGGGTDLVLAGVSGYTLAANVENLTLTGTSALGTGNSLANLLAGNAAANIMDGDAGNDRLTGFQGNDSLLGGSGDDTLNGVDLASAGVGEVDTLTGAADSDRFLLGYSLGRFYDDGNAASSGEGDYALITDFTPGADQLQLKGAAAQYSLGASPVAGVTGTAVFFDSNGAPGGNDELIAILQSSSELKVENVITPALFV